MNLKWQKPAAIFLLAAIAAGGVLGAVRYRHANTPVYSVDFMMDTIIEQKFYGENAQEAADKIRQELAHFENTFSMYRPESEITKLNEQAGVREVVLSEEAYRLLKRSAELSRSSKGAFDITIAPLTQAWGITSDHPHVPSEQEREAALSLVKIDDLVFDDALHTAELLRKGQAVDLGGIAKGAACDIVRQVAQEYGITKGYASIGGNLVVLDDKPAGKDLTFGVRDPKGDASQAIGAVTLYGKTMATTGGYERFFEEDGVTYHHVLDPKTGCPAQSDMLSVSVICEDGTLADYLSTTLFVLGKDAVLTCLNREDFQIIAVGADDTIYCSASLEGKILPVTTSHPYHFVYGG